LAGSALFLLLINPNNLFEVGFQLSYSAVFGIVFLQPKFEKLIDVNNKILRYFWQLLTVSVSAQIATFPLTAFYFNQFPTYFWLTNLVVIPAVILLIPLGFSLLAFQGIPILATVISAITNITIKILYNILEFVESLPFSVQKISFSNLELSFLIGILISFFLIIEYRKILHVKTLLFFFLLLISSTFILKLHTLNNKQIIVYNDSNNTVVHLISGQNNYIITNKNLSENSYSRVAIEKTVDKLHLKRPHFLLSGQKFSNQELILNNGFVIFQNKAIMIEPEQIPDETNLIPEIIINPVFPVNSNSNFNKSLIVSNKKYFNNDVITDSLFFSLQRKGAFIKNW
jgi:competence protein ComEC